MSPSPDNQSDNSKNTAATNFPFLQSTPRSVQLVYIDAGGGHRSAATALQTVIKNRFPRWDIKLLNLFEDVLRPIDLVHKIGHVPAEKIYNTMLGLNFTYGFTTGMRGLQKLIHLSAPKMEDLLRKHWEQETIKPDLVVSMIPHFNGIMFRALHDANPGTPYVTVMTDIADTPPHFWQEKQDQFLICGSGAAIKQAETLGYRPEQLFKASGMILKPHFYEIPSNADKREERKKLHLDPDLPTAIIMFGGTGAIVSAKIVDRLNKSGIGAQSIVMCGHNEKLRKELADKEACHPVGFTSDKVPYYMGLADFFIGKPGPVSISEAVHMGLPVILERNSKTMPPGKPRSLTGQTDPVPLGQFEIRLLLMK